MEDLSLCLDISSKPKRDILLVWMRALSLLTASLSCCSTERWFLWLRMSIKSITISPPKSRIRSCRAISSAASRLVFNAVSSISAPFVARAELMSIEIMASVWSITIEPPEGSCTSRENADWICDSIW